MVREIPSVGALSPEVRRVVEALKENVEDLRGTRGNSVKIKQLSNTASNDDIINKINELITHIQG